ncbi:MAG: hypothetical protein RIC55_21920 [Pirellulaceae bacterium]
MSGVWRFAVMGMMLLSATAAWAQTPPGQSLEQYDEANKLTTVADASGNVFYVCFDEGVEDWALTSVVSYPTVEYLELSKTKATDDGLGLLTGFTTIRVLHLEKTGVTDAGMESLQALAELEVLNLSDTAVTDEGVKQLAELENLRELRLSNTAVTDAAIESLAKLKGLKSVWLDGTKVTADGVARLRDALRTSHRLSGDAELAWSASIHYTPASADAGAEGDGAASENAADKDAGDGASPDEAKTDDASGKQDSE